VNPLEAFVLSLSGILVVLLLTSMFTILNNGLSANTDEQDLNNILIIHARGINTGALFNASYEPGHNGTLVISETSISLNNASRSNPGLAIIECDYNSLIISNGGVECSNH
jgi:hypothetical protein